MKKLMLIALVCMGAVSFAMQNTKQEWDGKYYQKNSSHQVRAAVELLKTLDLTQCTRIVDVGCGSGQVTAEIAKMAPQAYVIGIDPSIEMILAAHKAYSNTPKLFFAMQDAQEHISMVEPADLAFSSAVFLWIKNKKAAFDNIHKALKPNGLMVVKTTQPLPLDHPLNCALMKLGQNPKWLPLLQAYKSQPQHFPLSIEAAHELITSEKWNNISIESRSIVNTFITQEELSQWMLGFLRAMPAIAALDKQSQEDFAKEYVFEYVKIPEVYCAGTIIYSLPGLLIKAQKAQ